MGGESNHSSTAAAAWVRDHLLWLIIGTAAVIATGTAVVLATRDDARLTPTVKGRQLSRPDTLPRPTGTSTPTTTTPSTATTPAPTTTPGAGTPQGPVGIRRPAPGPGPSGGGPTTATTVRPTPPPTAPPQLGPALTVTRLLDWSPGLVVQQGTDVWAVEMLDSGRIARVDATGVRARGRAGPFVSGLAPLADGAWLLRSACPNGTGELVHVDATAAITAVVALPQRVVCDPSPGRSALAVTPGAVWIATVDPARAGRGILLDVDPATGAVVDRITFAGVPHDVQIDGAAVWVTLSDVPSVSSNDLLVQSFDPVTRQVVRRVVVAAPFGLPIMRNGSIWTGGASGVRRIPQAGGAEQVYATDGPGCGTGARFGFVAGAVTATTVWGTRLDLAANGPTGPVTQASVCRIDIASGRTIGWSPGSLRVAGGDDAGAWLADQAFGGLLRWGVA